MKHLATIRHLLLVFFIITLVINAEGKEIIRKHKYNPTRQDDTFYSSARDNVSIGPKIKYPKHPEGFSSSSERTFTGGQVNNIPFSNPSESLEIVPGLAVVH